LSFIFILAVFSTHFLKIDNKQALLSLFLKILNNNSKKVDGKEVDSKKVNSKIVDGKIAYSKDIDSGKVNSEKVDGFPADFALCLLLLSTKFYKERFSVYFLKLH